MPLLGLREHEAVTIRGVLPTSVKSLKASISEWLNGNDLKNAEILTIYFSMFSYLLLGDSVYCFP